MNVYVRVDASKEIGTGHFFRCMTLSLKLVSIGKKVTFVSRYMPEELINLLHQNHISFISIFKKPTTKIDTLNHSKWLGISQNEDANNFKKLTSKNFELLIIDHYALDKTWENEFSFLPIKILVIDDLADRMHDCNFLLDQNYFLNASSRYENILSRSTFKFLGPSFSLLNDDFIFYRNMNKKKDGYIQRIFIFFGGIDIENHTKLAIEALKKVNIKNIEVDVVVGGQNPNRSNIENICIENSYNFYCQTTKMAEIMSNADLAIGGGGSTTWERCCVGLPSIIVPIAQNQIEIAKDIHEFGAAICIEDSKNLVDDICNTINELELNNKVLKKMSQLCLSLVDGLGVERVLKKIKVNM